MRFKGGNLPTLMERVGRVSFLVVCLTTSVVAAATPSVPVPALLSGPYQVGELGIFNLKVTRNEVKGVYVSGARCDFKADDPLLEGTLEGSVFVGKLTTCLEGTGYSTRASSPFSASCLTSRSPATSRFPTRAPRLASTTGWARSNRLCVPQEAR